MHQAKLWAILILKLIEIKKILQQMSLQPLADIPRLAKLPFRPQTACMDHHCTTEAKADH